MFLDSHTGKAPVTSEDGEARPELVDFLGQKYVVYLTEESREAVREKVFGEKGLLSHAMRFSDVQALVSLVGGESVEPEPEATSPQKTWDAWKFITKGTDADERERRKDLVRIWFNSLPSTGKAKMGKNITAAVRTALNERFPDDASIPDPFVLEPEQPQD